MVSGLMTNHRTRSLPVRQIIGIMKILQKEITQLKEKMSRIKRENNVEKRDTKVRILHQKKNNG